MRRLLAALLCLFPLLTGCGGGGAADFAPLAPAEADRLVIYTSHKEAVYGPIVKEFEDRTGIWVQVETGGTAALLDRLEEERDAPRCDLLFGGGVDSLTARRELFDPYVSPLSKELPSACQCGDGSWTAFSILPVVLIYNPVLVRMNPPDGWASLLDPVWRGRIAFASPLASGSSYTALSTFLQALPGERDELLGALYANLDGRTLSDSGEVVGAVADGRYTIGVTLEETALKAVQAGSDVALLYPAEGTSATPDGMAVVLGCAHRDNARQFIDFCLSEDVQRRLTQSCRRPVREDLPASAPESEALVLLDYDLDQAVRERESVLERWRGLTGEDAS